jgi:hypothetical protein
MAGRRWRPLDDFPPLSLPPLLLRTFLRPLEQISFT